MYLFFNKETKKKRVYLDYASATPVRPHVVRAMAPYWSEHFGNPSAIHEEGVIARKAVDTARADIAALLKVRAHDVFFTGSGTESNNLAVLGVVDALAGEGRAYADMEIITTAIEHSSLIEACAVAKKRGVTITHAPVNSEGNIDKKAFQELLGEKTVLVTFAYANSEIGTVQDVKRLSRIVRLFRKERGECTTPYVHIDASQAPLYLPCQMDSMGIDLMTLDTGKCYGPKGVGVLARHGDVALVPQIAGGGQEFGIRSGTENVPLIVGAAMALHIAQISCEERAKKVTALREYFFETLKKIFPNVKTNGSRTERIANNINISIPGIDGEYAVVWLDTHGVSASTKSACDSGSGEGSAVVRILTGSDTRACETIRFSLGEETTTADIDRAIQILESHVHDVVQIH